MIDLEQLVRIGFVVGLCALPCAPACRRHYVASDNSASRGAADAPAMTPSAAGVDSSPGGRAKIRIAPRPGRGQRSTLTFCYDDNNVYDPQIYQVRVAGIDGARAIYEIKADGDAWLWKEWSVGNVPPGFRLVRGDALPAGIYEIYVDAFVGDGELRVSIDGNGNIKSLPWDKFDTGYSQTCPASDRKSPRIIPKPDSGAAEIIERHEQDAAEKHQHGRK